MTLNPCDITVYTIGWGPDAPAEGEGDTQALLAGLQHSRVVINGVEDERIVGVDIEARGGDFVEARLHVIPTAIRFVALSAEEFKAETLPGVTV